MNYKNTLKLGSIGLITLIMTSCSAPASYNSQSGNIKLDFKFPKKSFSLKAIPVSTEYIEIKVTGKGIAENEPIAKKVSRSDSESKVTINNLPVGEKTVGVKAFDKDNNLMAQAESKTDIVAGQSSTVTLELKELFNNLKIKLDNFPYDASRVISEVVVGSQTIQQETTGNEIDFGKIGSGNAKLKVTVFKEDSTPLAFINKEFNTNENISSVNLENISLPEVSELTLNTIPTELLNTLKKVIINFKNNNTPDRESIKLFVNGKEKEPSYINSVSTCLNQGDNLKIEVKASDKDNDSINYFWGRTSLFGDVYKMQLQSEKNNTLQKNVDFGFGNHSIGVIITDRKSYTGPFTLYFNVSPEPCK